jgi:hypothetical protein
MSAEARDEAVATCRAIVAGDLPPREGAARIWAVLAEADYPVETEEFRVFVGLASEIQDHPDRARAYESDIRDEASAVLARYRTV